jgi:hypothetical protein
MTPIRRSALAICSTLALLVAVPAFAQDKKAAPAPAAKPADDKAKAAAKGDEDRKVLFENDKVLATEVRYKPGQSSAMRERKERVTRALSDGTMERIHADGKKEVVHWKTGDVKFSPKATFVNKNIGKTDVVLYVVTLK